MKLVFCSSANPARRFNLLWTLIRKGRLLRILIKIPYKYDLFRISFLARPTVYFIQVRYSCNSDQLQYRFSYQKPNIFSFWCQQRTEDTVTGVILKTAVSLVEQDCNTGQELVITRNHCMEARTVQDSDQPMKQELVIPSTVQVRLTRTSFFNLSIDKKTLMFFITLSFSNLFTISSNSRWRV